LALAEALAKGMTDTLELQTHLRLPSLEALRIQVWALNKRLSDKFGVEWVFEFHSSNVMINSEIDWIMR
jgi:hypothetical protein